MEDARRLRWFAAALLVVNVAATVVAVVVNLPAQFGGVGTDAGSEFLLRGTAISAPLLPVVLLLVVVALAARPGAWGWVGIVTAYLAAIVVGMGGIGELQAAPTQDTPRAVLTGAGVAWLVIALVLAVLTAAAGQERRRARTAPQAARTSAAGDGSDDPEHLVP